MDKELLELQKKLKETRIFQQTDAVLDVCYSQKDVEKLIPHRDPFLFIETITNIDLTAKKAAGQFFLKPENKIFTGHFPGNPIFPGVLQVEMMGQLGLCLSNFVANETTEINAISKPVKAMATRVRDAVFMHTLSPNDTALIEVFLYDVNEISGVMGGQIYNSHHKLCSTAIMEVYYLE